MTRLFSTVLVLLAAVAANATGEHDWSHRYGGTGSDVGWTVAVDSAGNVLVTGIFSDTVNFGGGDLTSAGLWDIFVAKFDPDGAHLWSRRFGGTGYDEGWGIAADPDGRIFVSGHFQSTVNFGGGDLTSADASDVFLAAFDPDGNHLWSRGFGGAGDDWGWALAVDSAGNVTMTGTFLGSIDLGAGIVTTAGENDGFLASYDPAGNHRWSRTFGDDGWDEGYSVAVDGADNVIVTGYFDGSVDFGGGDLDAAGGSDVFLARYGPDGAHHWSQGFGDTAVDRGIKVAVDGTNAVSLVGYFYETIDLGGGAFTSAGSADIFLARFDADGTHQWSRRFGGTDADLGWAIAADPFGNVSVAGAFWGTTNLGGGDLTSAGLNDAFVAMYGTDGSHRWSERFGSTAGDEAYGIATGLPGGLGTPAPVIVTGYFSETVDFGGGPLTSVGVDDIFVVQFAESPVSAAPVATAPAMLAPNYPNPFNPRTTIVYTLPARATVSLEIHDASGALVARLDQGVRNEGTHRVNWDAVDATGRPLASGVYFCRLAAAGRVEVGRMLLLR